MSLLPVAEAQSRLLALAAPLEPETVPLVDALGRYLAEDVKALRNQPAAALSAMDGYALRFSEVPGPWRVVAELTPGRLPDRALAPGEAARIFTGAPLAAGADTVLVQEEARREGDMLHLAGEGPPAHGAHVRPAAGDFARGATLLRAGERIGPASVGLAAVSGHGTLTVRRSPRVALVSTGDELVPIGAPTSGVLLPSSNAPMLAALLQAATGVRADDRGIVRDDLAALTACFASASDADVLVTTGGASVGDHDLVRPALQAAGAEIDFWRIAMRPGKPLMAGRMGHTIVLGLPGNPVSAYVTACLFLLPLIRHLAGAARPLTPLRSARLAGALPRNGPRTAYLRASRAGARIRPLGEQDSAALAALAQADALIVRPPFAPAAATGTAVQILPLP